MNDQTRITIIGIHNDISPAQLKQIAKANILAGGQRHLASVAKIAGASTFTNEQFIISNNIEALVARLRLALQRQECAVVLASGDPLCFGIGTTLLRYFSPADLEIQPAPSSLQLAFSAIGQSWHDARFLSAHGRKIEDVMTQVRACTAAKIGFLTDASNTPNMLAQAMQSIGWPEQTRCAVCEQLGLPSARVWHGTLYAAAAPDQQFDPLNVLVVLRNAPLPMPISPGLPDHAFETSAGQLTKREVRLLALAELALQAGEVFWDIGAGSGSVSIEAGRAVPSAWVYAIEKRAEFVTHMQHNLARHAAPNVQIFHGLAPADCQQWPVPDAIFIGGSAGQLPDLITLAQTQLRPSGRLVLNIATLDHLQTVRQRLPDAIIYQVQINRTMPILNSHYLTSLNPIFIAKWVKA
ncbi:MAG: precorrin-6y C5,15-methyltransferase (decarboxylating) subunit CbiE [Anaerolineae bacterium]|nr:precorrin-6y C5,15-methyltransferase (decarboxylating) subunit CbiE [Anaerolineae bacterium]